MTNLISVEIDNLKCGGCAKTIVKGVSAIEGVHSVEVDHLTNTVRVEASAHLREAVVSKLEDMGYPEHGSVTGLDRGIATAKSFVSCAIGKMS
jgi:copper chaperone